MFQCLQRIIIFSHIPTVLTSWLNIRNNLITNVVKFLDKNSRKCPFDHHYFKKNSIIYGTVNCRHEYMY